MKRTSIWISTALALSLQLAFAGAAYAQGAKIIGSKVKPIDPQVVRDQDDMTWDDYKPVPGQDWVHSDTKPTSRTIHIALVLADFEDQPFVMTLPKGSDLFGNPKIDPIKREDIAKFNYDFWATPSEINHNHTVNEYWMELSHGRIGVDFTPFGPYRMPHKMSEYPEAANGGTGGGGGGGGRGRGARGANGATTGTQTRANDALTTASGLARGAGRRGGRGGRGAAAPTVANSETQIAAATARPAPTSDSEFQAADMQANTREANPRPQNGPTSFTRSRGVNISGRGTEAANANTPTSGTARGGRGRGGPGLSAELDPLWAKEAGDKKFDLKLRVWAGYDETSVWQEFGEMKFQTKEDITPEFGNPDPAKPRWLPSRYVPWTSFKAASFLWSNAAIVTSESSGAIRHEISHAAFRVGDNNNNPYIQPYRRVGSGPWDLMDRGSFNGPGGPHNRYVVPVTQGSSMPAGLMLRQQLNFKFLDPSDVLELNRSGLAKSGLAVCDVIAREAIHDKTNFAGMTVTFDDGGDKTPVEDPATHPLYSGDPTYNFYALEVVQRIGNDSFCPDSGVLVSKNKDREGQTGGPNSFNCFNWVIDAHPEDIKKLDFKRPNGEPVMRTIADYRQLNDALFHAGVDSGSQYEWEDTPNRLHFYIIDVKRNKDGILSYTVAVRSLDGAGPQSRGVEISGGKAGGASEGPKKIEFTLENTGKAVHTDPKLHRQDTNNYLDSDVYRLSASIEGKGWSAELPNALAAVKFGKEQPVAVYADHEAGADKTATVTITATSESDPSKKATKTFKLEM